MNTTTKAIGTFECKSGELRIADPCYGVDHANDWVCAASRCRTGTWKAEIEETNAGAWGRRVSVLRAVHASGGTVVESKQWMIGVDSGQAGIFDAALFSDDDYDEWCKITLGKGSAGTREYGAVSSSGFGDGGYTATLGIDRDGFVVEVDIVFITEEELA